MNWPCRNGSGAVRARGKDEGPWRTENEFFFFFLTFFLIYILVINAVETDIFLNPCVPVVSGDTAGVLDAVDEFILYSVHTQR